MITKDGRDTPIEKLTAENYVVPRGEERSYHAVIEVKQFDPKTGERLSTPRIQKFGKKIFESSVRASLKKQGYDIVILHDPNQWIQEQQEKAAEKAKAAAEAKAKAEKEAFDAAVAAAVAKEIANLKAEDGATDKAENGANDKTENKAENGANDKTEKGKKAEK